MLEKVRTAWGKILNLKRLMIELYLKSADCQLFGVVINGVLHRGILFKNRIDPFSIPEFWQWYGIRHADDDRSKPHTLCPHQYPQENFFGTFILLHRPKDKDYIVEEETVIEDYGYIYHVSNMD